MNTKNYVVYMLLLMLIYAWPAILRILYMKEASPPENLSFLLYLNQYVFLLKKFTSIVKYLSLITKVCVVEVDEIDVDNMTGIY